MQIYIKNELARELFLGIGFNKLLYQLIKLRYHKICLRAHHTYDANKFN